ncbi:MAG: UDP-2,3-diacylglucosamine diphosphatase [Pseudomonadota bacterium]
MQLSTVDPISLPPTRKLAALLISDVHLKQESPQTAAAFFQFLENVGTQTQQLYLLGDLFEYWAGDDDRDAPFNARVVSALRKLSDVGVKVFWMAGNRDFLVGPAFMLATGATYLRDPSVVSIAGRSIVLTHGDAQCTDDVDYQLFRSQVRAARWQQDFLARPLPERLVVINQMREQSRVAQSVKTQQIMDVNTQAVDALFTATDTSLMIHGHTHRPGVHESVLNDERVVRHVLPDWDFENGATRGGGIAIDANGIVAAVNVCS